MQAQATQIPAEQCGAGGELLHAGKPGEALPLLEAGATAWQPASVIERWQVGNCTRSMGFARAMLGDFRGAIEPYRQAITIYQAILDAPPPDFPENVTLAITEAVVATTNSLGQLHRLLGEPALALSLFQETVALAEKHDFHAEHSLALNEMGNLQSQQGQYDDALASYRQALLVAQQSSNPQQEASVLNNIGVLLITLGRHAEALEALEKVLSMSTELETPPAPQTIANVGALYLRRGAYDDALRFFEQALAGFRAANNPRLSGTLNGIGQIFAARGDYPAALNQFEQAFELAQQNGERTEEAVSLNNIGAVYTEQGSFDQALAAHRQALLIREEIGDSLGALASFNNLGNIERERGEFAVARDWLESGLALADNLGVQAEKATLLDNLGSLNHAQGQIKQALAAHQQALALREAAGDWAGMAITLNNLGTIYATSNDYGAAVAHYEEALTVARQYGLLSLESTLLGNLASVALDQGRYEAAQEGFQASLAIHRELGERGRELNALAGIGQVSDRRGDATAARRQYEEVLTLAREFGLPAAEFTALNNLGGTYLAQGQYAQAIEHYQQALALARAKGMRQQEQTALGNLGAVRREQGQPVESEALSDQALKLARELDERDGEAMSLINRGLARQDQSLVALNGIERRRLQDLALADYGAALALAEEFGLRPTQSLALNNIGVLLSEQEQHAQARQFLDRALVIDRALGERGDEAITLINIADNLRYQQQYAEALPFYGQAIELARGVGAAQTEALALINLARVHELAGRPAEALTHYERAMGLLGTIRAVAGDDRSRAGFIARFAIVYERAARLYLAKGDKSAAFETVERGRARAFLDTVVTGMPLLTDAPRNELLERAIAADAQLEAARRELALAVSENDVQVVATLEHRFATAEQAFAAAQAELQRKGGQLTTLIPGEGSVRSLGAIQALLQPGTTMLVYHVGAETTLAFVVTSSSIDATELFVGRATIDSQIRALLSFDPQSSDPGAELYSRLLAPLTLPSVTRQLLIVPHGVLHYLPFAALQDGDGRYLSERYPLTLIPAASLLPHLQSDTDSQPSYARALVLANPDGPPAVPEVLTVARLIGELFTSRPLLQGEATEEALRDAAPAANIIHLGAHGSFNPRQPLESYIQLAPSSSDDGRLTAAEVYSLDLSSAELVVLSACETQVNQIASAEAPLAVTAGDDLAGLTRAFLFAGAPTVVASLWQVDSDATAMLLERFYSNLRAGEVPAEALSRAQQEVRTYRDEKGEQPYADPHFWAAFVLVGDGGVVPPPTPWWLWALGAGAGAAIGFGGALWWRRRTGNTQVLTHE